MKNFFLILALSSLTALSSCSTQDTGSSADTQISQSGSEIQENMSLEEVKEVRTQEAIQTKIETIRKRLALKGLIIDGDSYYREGKIALALTKYLQFYRENPDDQLIIEKLGESYFAMHKYLSAYSYYSKISDPSEAVREKLALSLMHDIDFNSVSQIKAAQNTLKDLLPEGQEQYYYVNSLECVLDFHQCKLSFNEYFWPEEAETTDTNPQQPEIEHPKLLGIKNAIENYRNFKLDEVYLKDAYIVASWYTNDMYSLSSHMGENILSYKPGYKPILKIVAQSYFSLGNYELSREALLKYQQIDDQDPAVNYMLGVIHTQMRDYVLANIYFSKALELGSVESLEIRRQLIHNFYQLDNQTGILSEFQKLIENETAYTPNDLGLAIYYHILEGDYDTASQWAKSGIERFPEQGGNFYAYQAWILREQGEIDMADSLLQTADETYPENPFILINRGYIALEKGQIGSAVSHLKNVEKNFPNTEFALSAQQQLDILSQ